MAKKLYVGGLPYSTSEDELRDAFSQAGAVASSSIIMDRMSGRSKGFGFVEMTTQAEAEKARLMATMMSGTSALERPTCCACSTRNASLKRASVNTAPTAKSPVKSDQLAARVLELEHHIYPLALKLLAEGRLHVENGHCLIDGVPVPDIARLIPVP